MGVLFKLFGSSKLQEEFQKSMSLRLPLIISSINDIEFTFKQTQLRKKNCSTKILFDFENNLLFIRGNLFEELFDETSFQITRASNLSGIIEIFISPAHSSDVIVMKCIVYRNDILFQGTLENWDCKISNHFQISH